MGGVMNPTIFFLLDFVLFLVVLLIILFYRQLDRKDRQIHLVKALMLNMQTELDEKFRKMRTAVDAMEDAVQGHEITVSSLLKKVDNSLGELGKHAEDLDKLHSYISHYHRVLKDLEKQTEKAESRTALLKEDIAVLGDMGEQIERYSREVEQLAEKIELHSGKFLQQVEAARSEFSLRCREEFDEQLAQAVDQLKKQARAAAEEMRIPAAAPSPPPVRTEPKPAARPQRTSAPVSSSADYPPWPMDEDDEILDDFIGGLSEDEDSTDDTPLPPDSSTDELEEDLQEAMEEIDESLPDSELTPGELEEEGLYEVDTDEEEIIIEDDDDDFRTYLNGGETDGKQDEEFAGRMSKKETVQRYASLGKEAAEISEITGIPRGEVELILELNDFTRSG
jgi:uncharacterized phage infection (PIP) family protein YhgE